MLFLHCMVLTDLSCLERIRCPLLHQICQSWRMCHRQSTMKCQVWSWIVACGKDLIKNGMPLFDAIALTLLQSSQPKDGRLQVLPSLFAHTFVGTSIRCQPFSGSHNAPIQLNICFHSADLVILQILMNIPIRKLPYGILLLLD